MERTRPTAPGLKWRPRKAGPVPYWVASAAAVAAGFTPKAVRLSGSPEAITARCERLQLEMAHFLGGGRAPAFDGTWAALFDRYERDPESPYHRIRPGTAHPYRVYLRKLRGHIGDRRISECDGRDARRWFAIWSGGADLTYGPKLAAAQTALSIVKAALGWGIACRLPDCAAFRAILAEIEFPHSKRRTAAPGAAEIERARAAARAAGRPGRALAYALQFETVLRQWDVIGEWVPLSDPRPSAVLGYGLKWIGAQWSHVGADLVVRYTPSKTELTSGAQITADLRACPMVLDELERVPAAVRVGPLVIDERTGLPYRYHRFRDGWRADFKAAGIPRNVWNRDFRAGGISEGSKAGATKDDLKRIGGHTDGSRSAEIYDRAQLEAHRRVAAARKAFREGGEV